VVACYRGDSPEFLGAVLVHETAPHNLRSVPAPGSQFAGAQQVLTGVSSRV